MWSALAIAFIIALIFGSIYETEYHHTGSISVDKVHSCVAYSYSAKCRVETEVGRLNVTGHVAPGDKIHEYCHYNPWTKVQNNDICIYQRRYDGEKSKY